MDANLREAKLVGLEGDGCTVELRFGGVHEQVAYAQRNGTKGGKGNARLQRLPPSLAPGSRTSHGIDDETVAAVRIYVEERCARSPHQRDHICRRVATHLEEEEQALILTETRGELFEGFKSKRPTFKIGRTKFYESNSYS